MRHLYLLAVVALMTLPQMLNGQVVVESDPEIALPPSGIPVMPYVDEPQSSAAELSGYVWQSRVLRRSDDNGADSTRVDPVIPRLYTSGIELRGIGQIFAPYALFKTYSPSVYNTTSGIIGYTDPNLTDQDWIDQFKGAASFEVDSFRFFVYKNLNVNYVPTDNGYVYVWRTNFDVTSAGYASNGIVLPRNSSNLMGFADYNNQPIERNISAEDLNATAMEGGTPGTYRLIASTFRFDPPLTAGARESIIAMYANEVAPGWNSQSPPDADYQRVIAGLEYRGGEYGDSTNILRSPLDNKQSFGVVMHRNVSAPAVDTIYSAFNHLYYTVKSGTTINARMNLSMTFWGRVDLVSGVTYHFGERAANQGIGVVTPNPARDVVEIPFALLRTSSVRIDLYNNSGELVRSCVDGRYVEGNYSYKLSLDGLPSGAYHVRMLTNGESTTKTLVINNY